MYKFYCISVGPTPQKAQALDLLAGVYLASNEKDEVRDATRATNGVLDAS